MNISDLMTENPNTIQQDATLREALEMMDRLGCHHLPVMNLHGDLVGLFTSRHGQQALHMTITGRHQPHENRLLDSLPISALMTLIPVVVQAETPVDEAIQLMLDKRIGCLPVMRNNKLVGIVTTTDVLRFCVKQLQIPQTS
jgi:CBS domain-containing protein